MSFVGLPDPAPRGCAAPVLAWKALLVVFLGPLKVLLFLGPPSCGTCSSDQVLGPLRSLLSHGIGRPHRLVLEVVNHCSSGLCLQHLNTLLSLLPRLRMPSVTWAADGFIMGRRVPVDCWAAESR